MIRPHKVEKLVQTVRKGLRANYEEIRAVFRLDTRRGAMHTGSQYLHNRALCPRITAPLAALVTLHGNTGRSRTTVNAPIIQTDVHGKRIATYENAGVASRVTQIPVEQIQRASLRRGKAGDFFWHRADSMRKRRA
jgi:hypothetical protein